jgi:hypothetical protein
VSGEAELAGISLDLALVQAAAYRIKKIYKSDSSVIQYFPLISRICQPTQNDAWRLKPLRERGVCLRRLKRFISTR